MLLRKIAAAAMIVAAPVHAETVAFTAARMLDVATGRYVASPVVVVTDGRIVAAGAGVAVPAGAKRVDLGGLTLLPGLIDMHVHLDSVPRYGGYSGLQFSDAYFVVAAAANARAMLDAGFTTVRNVGSTGYSDVGLREAIDDGLVPGPRIVSAAYALGATGGHCDETYFPPSFARQSPAVVNGVEQARLRVREQRKYGAQVIKVCATGGVFSRNTEPGQQQLHEGELAAIVDEAKLWGLRVAAHAHGATGIKAAIRAGVHTIEHASLIDAEGIALAKARGAYLSMDIYNTDYTQAEGAKNGVMEDNLRKDREVAQIQRDNFRAAHKAGVKLVFATDAGVMPHDLAARQFATMVQYGMTPAEAIRAATATAAEALGMADRGTLAAGRWGDMIAVAGDPLADVAALTRVAVVIKGGVVVKDAR